MGSLGSVGSSRSRSSTLNPNSPTRGILKSEPTSPNRHIPQGSLQNVQARRGVLLRTHTNASATSVDTALVRPLDYLSFNPHGDEDDEGGYGNYSPRSPACSTFGGASNYTASVYSPVVRFQESSDAVTPRMPSGVKFAERSNPNTGLGVMKAREEVSHMRRH